MVHVRAGQDLFPDSGPDLRAEPGPQLRAEPGLDLRAESGPQLRAEPGDTLIIDGAGSAGLPRVGTVVGVSGDGAPPYVVHWHAGDYESRIWPSPAARVQKRRRPLALA
jgi:hypothetical protein